MKRNKEPEEGDLSKTLRLLALVALNGKKLKEQVALMSRAGFRPSEMAVLLGTSPNSVSVRLSEFKAEAKMASKER